MTSLQVISSSGFYGAEAVVLNLMNSLRRLNSRSVLCAFRNELNPNSELADRARDCGLEVRDIPCGGKLDWNAVREIRRIANECDASVVHTHGYKSNIYGFLAARRLSSALVATCHNWTGDTWKLRVYAALDRALLKRFHKVVGVSESIAMDLQRHGVSAEKIHVLFNGIDVQAFRSAEPSLRKSVPAGRKVIGLVGRLVENKGFEYAIRALAKIQDSFPEAQLVIVGDGPDRERLLGIASQVGVKDRVTFTGARGDMPAVYRSFDVFVLPSFNEGMPMVVLEAMAAGVPVVATRVGGIPDMVCHGETGFLVEPAKTDELADALGQLLRDEGLSNRTGALGQEFVARTFSADAMAAKYLEIYQQARPVSPQGSLAALNYSIRAQNSGGAEIQ